MEMKKINPFIWKVLLWIFLGGVSTGMLVIEFFEGNMFLMVWNLCYVIFDSVMLGYSFSKFVGWRCLAKANTDFTKIIKELDKEIEKQEEPFKEFDND